MTAALEVGSFPTCAVLCCARTHSLTAQVRNCARKKEEIERREERGPEREREREREDGRDGRITVL